jgi:hypothetical protein
VSALSKPVCRRNSLLMAKKSTKCFLKSGTNPRVGPTARRASNDKRPGCCAPVPRA